MALTDKLTAIGDAIREKTGSTAKLSLDQMVDEIEGISAGGGGGAEVESDIIFRTITSYTNDRVTTVRDSAFYYCTALVDVSLQNVTTLGAACFHGCSNLETFHAPMLTKLGGGSEFRSCIKLKTIDTRNITTMASTYTFDGCSELTKLEFNTLGSIGYYTFRNCSKLATLVIRTNSRITLNATNSFEGTPIASGTGYIYVPDELVESYKVGTNWASYANAIKPLSEYVEVTE